MPNIVNWDVWGTTILKIVFFFFNSFRLRQLEPDKNLVDQCVKGEGLVQINVQVRTSSKRINIVDVLKPTDDVLGSEIESNLGIE